MVTIAHLVEKQIEDKPFLQEALSKRLINYGALAELLKPEIEKTLKKEIKHSAIMMALRRYADKLEEQFIKPLILPKFAESELTLKSDIIDIAVLKSPTIFSILKKFYDLVDFEKGDFLNIVQGNYEITILTSKKYKNKFLKQLEKEKVVKVKEDLTALSLKFSEEFFEIPGFVFIIIRTLAWQNINIYEFVSTYTELTFILNKEDSIKGYNALQNLIGKSKDSKNKNVRK